MHIQRIVLLGSAGLGVVATLMPWLSSSFPLIGILESAATSPWGYITVGLSVLAATMALLGDRKAPLGRMKQAISTAAGLGLAGAGVFLMLTIKDALGESTGEAAGNAGGEAGRELGGKLGKMLSGEISVGMGVYLLIVAGAAVAVLPLVFAKKPKKD